MTGTLGRHLPWVLVGLIGATALAIIATARGEPVGAIWIVVAAVSVYLIAYRYYARFIADKVMRLDPKRPTPAVRHNDGLDYVPTDRIVLFGHHFAAIAGAGPLVGPVLAAQMGYLPGMLWILAGVVFAGAVQDFMVLFVSMRRDGRSLGELIRAEMGAGPRRHRAVRHLHDHGDHPRRAGADRREGAGREPLGHLHRDRDDPDRAAHGRLSRFIRPGRDRRGLGDRLRAADAGDRRRAVVQPRPGLGAGLHLHRRAAAGC